MCRMKPPRASATPPASCRRRWDEAAVRSGAPRRVGVAFPHVDVCAFVSEGELVGIVELVGIDRKLNRAGRLLLQREDWATLLAAEAGDGWTRRGSPGATGRTSQIDASPGTRESHDQQWWNVPIAEQVTEQ